MDTSIKNIYTEDWNMDNDSWLEELIQEQDMMSWLEEEYKKSIEQAVK